MDARKPLEGIRILSLAEQYPGPYATLLLGDLGADVVQVERPGAGDPARSVGPAFFESLARGKRSIELDLKDPAGRTHFLGLVAGADVVLEGFRPGAMERLGLDWPALREVNPELILVSISGFGQDGPDRLRPAHDLSYQALAGFLHANPVVPVVEAGDLAGGTFAALAVMVGLFRRATGNGGSYTDVSMLDTLVSWMTAPIFAALHGGHAALPAQPGYEVYACGDGALLTVSMSYEDKFWRALCEVLELGELAALDLREREARFRELRHRVAAALARRPRAEWEAALVAADVPCGAVLTPAEVAEQPQVVARELLVEVGKRRFVRQPLIIDGRRLGPATGAPDLGEHTEDVLAELAAGTRAA